MRAVLLGILGFLAGFVVVAFAVFLAYIVFTVVTDYHDFEGTTAMGMAFAVIPVASLIGGIIGAALFVRWFARKRTVA